ncbi:unnamed protein product [Rotaria sp. Silwood2]|nr:unnamed protein product [Rotaria sp. Silwood2]
MAQIQESHGYFDEDNILSRNNLSLCKADYFETCWCKVNSTESIICPYLLRHVISFSNSSYFCVYHTIRKAIECFNSTSIFPKTDSVSTIYVYLTIVIFTIGFIGNGLSMIILLNKTLRRLGFYRNLTILCAFNIFYLLAISIRHINTYSQDLRHISPEVCRLHTFIVAFTGHLCSWQLVSTSIQRVHALFSLHPHQTKSWFLFVYSIAKYSDPTFATDPRTRSYHAYREWQRLSALKDAESIPMRDSSKRRDQEK